MEQSLNKTIVFTVDEMIAMATFISQLVREGVVYTVTKCGSEWSIELTGGY